MAKKEQQKIRIKQARRRFLTAVPIAWIFASMVETLNLQGHFILHILLGICIGGLTWTVVDLVYKRFKL